MRLTPERLHEMRTILKSANNPLTRIAACEVFAEIDALRAECSGMGKLLESGIVIKTEEYIEYIALKAQINVLMEALQNIAYGKFHIGNDENGNIYGPPDRVMCWKFAQEALTAIEKGRNK